MELNDIVVQVSDICSSGSDPTSEWHIATLTELFLNVPSNKRTELLSMIVDSANDCEGWRLEELNMIKDILGTDAKVIFSLKHGDSK